MKKQYEPSGPDVNGWKKEAEDKTTGILSSPAFKKACKSLGVLPTRRQAARYWKGRGRVRNDIV